MYAMTHIAIHDALNAIDRRSRAVRVRRAARTRLPRRPPRSAAAARDVLVPVLGQLQAPFPQACIDAGVASVESDYAAALDAIPDGTRKGRGLAVGHAAAAAILAVRAGDGSDTTLLDFDFPQGTAPGEWIFTPIGRSPSAPGWAQRHAVRARGRDAVPARPAGRAHVAGVRRGSQRDQGARRRRSHHAECPYCRADRDRAVLAGELTAEWNRIARTLATEQRLDSWESARLYGLLNLALADGYIATFDTKYHYLYWRPVSAIHAADSDGNPATSADPTWTPLRDDAAHPRLRLRPRGRRRGSRRRSSAATSPPTACRSAHAA